MDLLIRMDLHTAFGSKFGKTMVMYRDSYEGLKWFADECGFELDNGAIKQRMGLQVGEYIGAASILEEDDSNDPYGPDDDDSDLQ